MRAVTRKILSGALALSLACVANSASAQEHVSPDVLGAPNAWERARDPHAERDFAIHVTVRQMLAEAAENGDDMGPVDAHSSSIREAMLARAFLALHSVLDAGSTDARLRYDLGDVLSAQRRWDNAAEIIAGVLHDAPNAPEAHRAWLTLAFANAHRDKPEEERAAYIRFLEDESASHARIIPLLNLAEADMRTHRLSEAIAGYREVEQLSAQLAQGTQTGILAVWGLAIALDRAGDSRGAAAQARLASQMDPEDRFVQRRPVIGDKNTVFFEPDYEIYWYLALGSTEDAKQAATATMAKFYWSRAVTLWKAYLVPAEAAVPKEAWNSIAKSHLANAEKQLKAASDRAQKEPKKAPADVGY